MSYTPTTWTTGDTITATALNKIENGIASAGGGNFAVVTLSATSGFSSATKIFGVIVYAIRANDSWVVIDDDFYNNPYFHINGYSTPQQTATPPLPILSDGTMYPFLLLMTGNYVNTTGDISDTPETLHYSYGSVVLEDAFRISGSGSVQFALE